MKKEGSKKLLNTLLSILISFLVIFIVIMFTRSLSTNILPNTNKVSIFINDYLDMMMRKVDNLSLKLNIKRNTVSQYQVDLINQSIDDYVDYSIFQSSENLSSYNPNISPSAVILDRYKNNYYKMTVENPYLKSMTIFNIKGQMILNLYLSGNKSWPLELKPSLIDDIKKDNSLVLNMSNENSFYVMQYMKNKNGEFVVATRNDYSYVSDIAKYYQVADKSLYVSDSENIVYNIPDGIVSTSVDKVSTVISRYAYYKNQPSFVNNNAGLAVTLVGREYPNYFELIVLGITAFFIVMFQFIIKGLLYSLSLLIGMHKKNTESYPLPPQDVPMIDEDITTVELPQSVSYEDIPDGNKVIHKVEDEYIEALKDNSLNIDNISEKFPNLEGMVQDSIDTTYEEDIINDLDNEAVDIDDDSDDILYASKQDIDSATEVEDNMVESVEVENIFINSDDIKENFVYNTNDSTLDKDTSNEVKKDILESDNMKVNREGDDVFVAFDKMLSSIINKAELEARDSLVKRD